MKCFKKVLFSSSFVLTMLLAFNTSPTVLLAQGQGGCYNIQGGTAGKIMGIPTCTCGRGLECLCITPTECPPEQ